MISERLRELMETNIKLTLPKEDWNNIEDMFTEIYYTVEDGVGLVALKPSVSGRGDGTGNLSMIFTELNGAYYDIQPWDEIKKSWRRVQ